MNLYSIKTKEDLKTYGDEFLVVTEDIQASKVTGFPRAIALLDFVANFRNRTITLVVGVYELDVNGEPIISESLKPYEASLTAHNGRFVNMETQEVVAEEEKKEGKTYMGEFDFYMYVTKNTQVSLWQLFESVIKTSKVINQ